MVFGSLLSLIFSFLGFLTQIKIYNFEKINPSCIICYSNCKTNLIKIVIFTQSYSELKINFSIKFIQYWILDEYKQFPYTLHIISPNHIQQKLLRQAQLYIFLIQKEMQFYHIQSATQLMHFLLRQTAQEVTLSVRSSVHPFVHNHFQKADQGWLPLLKGGH